MSKKLTNTTGYERPKKTYQDTLTNKEIKEKLAEYKKCTDIKKVSIGTHLRYFTTDPETKKLLFRLGGTLNKIDPEGRYVILNNGTVSWSVQINGTQFWQKLSEAEIKEELKEGLKEELKKELLTDSHANIDQENKELKKEIKILYKKIETLDNENEKLKDQLNKIVDEIKKNKKIKK
jgi:hypothetical protein